MHEAHELALSDYSSPSVLECDAPGTGIGGVLMQSKRPIIAVYSKALGIKAAALSTFKKEAFAIIESVKKWRHYLLGSSLIIKTYHQSINFVSDQRVTLEFSINWAE